MARKTKKQKREDLRKAIVDLLKKNIFKSGENKGKFRGMTGESIAKRLGMFEICAGSKYVDSEVEYEIEDICRETKCIVESSRSYSTGTQSFRYKSNEEFQKEREYEREEDRNEVKANNFCRNHPKVRKVTRKEEEDDTRPIGQSWVYGESVYFDLYGKGSPTKPFRLIIEDAGFFKDVTSLGNVETILKAAHDYLRALNEAGVSIVDDDDE